METRGRRAAPGEPAGCVEVAAPSLAEQPADVLALVGAELSDALTPGHLTALASTCGTLALALRAAVAELKETLHAERRSGAAAVQAELKKEQRAMAGVVAADEAAVLRFSEQLNDAMVKLEPGADTRNWFVLFKHLDADHTGLITFDEMEAMVRHELRLGRCELSWRDQRHPTSLSLRFGLGRTNTHESVVVAQVQVVVVEVIRHFIIL